MFLLQYSLEVKLDERLRLEDTLKVKQSLNKLIFTFEDKRWRKPRWRRKKKSWRSQRRRSTRSCRKTTDCPWRPRKSTFLKYWQLWDYFSIKGWARGKNNQRERWRNKKKKWRNYSVKIRYLRPERRVHKVYVLWKILVKNLTWRLEEREGIYGNGWWIK